MQQLNTPGTRFSKSGITRCSNKHDCKLGGYFHVECCYNADKKFDMKKKARDRWFCLACKEQGKSTELKSKPAILKQPTEVKSEAIAIIPDVITEIKQSSPKKIAAVGEKSPSLKRRTTRRIQIKTTDEVIKPALKRPKLDENPKSLEPLVAENPVKLSDTEPIILI